MAAVYAPSLSARSVAPGTLTASMAPGAATVRTPALRYWRVQRMLLQEELAKLADVAASSVRRGESGELLRLTTVRALAAALKVPATDLMAQPPSAP